MSSGSASGPPDRTCLSHLGRILTLTTSPVLSGCGGAVAPSPSPHRGPSAACISDFILSVTAQSYFLFSNHWFLCCFYFLPLLFPPQTSVLPSLVSLFYSTPAPYLPITTHTPSSPVKLLRLFLLLHLTLSLLWTVLQTLSFWLLPLVFKQRFGFWTWSPPPSSSLA